MERPEDTFPVNGMLNLRSLREQVYGYIRGEMQAGRLIAGSLIKLNEISQLLGISKTPLRDALIRLESEGFVTILPRRGVVVKALSFEEVKNVLEIVGALESAVILSVFERLAPPHVERMARLNQEMRDLLHSSRLQSFDLKYYELNLAFHAVFLDLSSNTDLRRIVMLAKQRLYDFPRPRYIRKWELINCDEHEQFIAHVRAGDRQAAATLWKEHHWSFEAHEEYIREFYSLGSQQIRQDLDRLK